MWGRVNGRHSAMVERRPGISAMNSRDLGYEFKEPQNDLTPRPARDGRARHPWQAQQPDDLAWLPHAKTASRGGRPISPSGSIATSAAGRQIPFGRVTDRTHDRRMELIRLGDPGDGSALQIDRMGVRRREQPPLRRRVSDDRRARQYRCGRSGHRSRRPREDPSQISPRRTAHPKERSPSQAAAPDLGHLPARS